jgi:hypothetical protein
VQLSESQPDSQHKCPPALRTVVIRDTFRIDVQDTFDRFIANRSAYPNWTQHRLAFKAALDRRCGCYARGNAQNEHQHRLALAEFDRLAGVRK